MSKYNSHHLLHLRRIVKVQNLPLALRSRESSAEASTGSDSNGSISTSNGRRRRRKRQPSGTDDEPPNLHLLACPTSMCPPEVVLQAISTVLAAADDKSQCRLSTTLVPKVPPMSYDEAAQWSLEYWPCVYRRMNPYGPQPAAIEKAEAQLHRNDASIYMAYARKVAEAGKKAGLGLQIGAVVAERSWGTLSIVAAAADARCHLAAGYQTSNPLEHPVMRVIGMVAQQRRIMVRGYDTDPQNPGDEALTSIEAEIIQQSELKPSGYLCVDLEIFLTHEPCVMCSMALLHSRFGKVIIGHRMPKTGGLTADKDLGLNYGLFWRPELNWKFLAWEWQDEHGKDLMIDDTTHA